MTDPVCLPWFHTPSELLHDTCSNWHMSASAGRAASVVQLSGASGGGGGGPFGTTRYQTHTNLVFLAVVGLVESFGKPMQLLEGRHNPHTLHSKDT